MTDLDPAMRMTTAIETALRPVRPRNQNDRMAAGCVLMVMASDLLKATVGRAGAAQIFYGEADKLAAEPSEQSDRQPTGG